MTDKMAGKRILILGAGNAQIDLIQYCREHQMEVYGCSYSDNDPGISLLHHFEKINIIDTEAVAAYARKIQADFVYSVGSDIAMPTVAKVSEKLSLPLFMSVQAARISCNKHLLREALSESPYHIPYRCVSSFGETEGWDAWPVSVKPVDSQGQRGVSMAENTAQLQEAFERAQQYSRRKLVILEQFIKGKEVSVNAFFRGGKMVFSRITDRESYPQFPGGIIHRHYIPSEFEQTDVRKRILDLAEDIANRLSILEGPVYYQIMIKDGRPYLIEVTPRLDGCHMWRLIKMYEGVDLLDMTMQYLCSLTEKKAESVRKETGGFTQPGKALQAGEPLMTEFFTQPPKTRFSPEMFEALPAMYREFYYQAGDEVKPINGYMEKCGFRITASCREEGQAAPQ